MKWLHVYDGTSHNGPDNLSIKETLAVTPSEITTELVFNQPPMSGRFWFRTMDKLRVPNWPTLYNSACYNRRTGNYIYLSCRNLILEEHKNFNIELHEKYW